MELRTGRHSAAKALWNQLRVVFFVMRKSFAWKQQQLLLEVKMLGESLGDFMYGRRLERPLFGLREHEFSCSNTPNHPIFYGCRRRYKAGKRRHGYLLPCSHGSVAVAEREDYNRRSSPRRSAVILPAAAKSSFAVSISNYSSDDENLRRSAKVDDEAEEFIRKFYEQLRQQSRMPLLHCQEKELQEDYELS